MADNGKTIQDLAAENTLLKERIRQLEADDRGHDLTRDPPQESMARYRLLAERMTDILWIRDLDLRTLHVSPSNEKMLGFTAEERVLQDVSEQLTPASLSAVHDLLARELAHEERGDADPDRTITLEVEYYHKDGSTRWGEDIVSGIRNDNGELIGIHGVTRDITDRKRAEEALQESEAKLSALFASMTEMVVMHELVFDEAGTPVNYRITDCNAAYTRITGIHREDAIGKLADEVYGTPEPPYLDKYSRVGVTGKADRYETYFPPMDKHFAISVVSPGKNRFATITTDISEIKRSQEDLRKSEEEHRRLFETMVQGVIYQTADGTIISANPAAERILGLSFDQMQGKTSRDPRWKMTKEDGSEVPGAEHPAMIALRTGKTVGPVTRGVFHPGRNTHLWLSITAIPLFQPGETVPFQVYATFDDITDRKRAEEALRESEEKFRHIFEKAEEGISIVREGVFEFINPAFQRILGYSIDELTSIPIESFIHPDDKAMVVDRNRRRLQGEQVETGYDFRVIASDGTVKWLTIHSQLIDWEGAPANLSFLVDITDRKRAEEEKLGLEKQLARAQKLESLGTLAGGIAHDFNNLLMGIQGNASLVLIDLDSSHPHYERLKSIEESVASGADLTRQLLGFARGGRYDMKPLSMNEVLEKSAVMFGRTKKEIALHRKYSKDPCIVEADRSQMEQVFMNLFVNAWHAMPGGGNIFIETETVIVDVDRAAAGAIDPGRYIKVNVTDTGTGMDEKTRDRIFDPFFTTKSMARGTGLGLASVYGIVKGHGGMISVYSEPGHGTTFTLYLPASGKEPAGEKAITGNVLKGTETILLVDDEQMILDVSRDMLESLGYQVYTALSGQEGLAVYSEKKDEIDLVVLDVIMPGMSGSGTFDQLREINPAVKVLLASGYSIDGLARDIIERGCNGFIQKPFQLEQLSLQVREMLDI